MKRLPHWCITDKFPALYDTESATAIEQTAKLYGAMNELIDDYNAFVDRINEEIEAFETSSEKNYELFSVSMRQEFQDFIDTIELKVKAQDKAISDKFTEQDTTLDNSIKAQETKIANAINQQNEVINDAVNYMKTNLTTTLNSVIAEMKANGEFSEEVKKVFNELVNDINVLTNRMNTFTSLEEGSTTADAELIDIRNGYDGTVYETAGEAVRGQVSQLSGEIKDMGQRIIYAVEKKESVLYDFTENVNSGSSVNAIVVNMNPITFADIKNVTVCHPYASKKSFSVFIVSLNNGNLSVLERYDITPTESLLSHTVDINYSVGENETVYIGVYSAENNCISLNFDDDYHPTRKGYIVFTEDNGVWTVYAENRHYVARTKVELISYIRHNYAEKTELENVETIVNALKGNYSLGEFVFSAEHPCSADMTFIKNQLVRFTPSDSGSGYAFFLNVDMENKTITLSETKTHDLGHVNSIDYCEHTDCLIFGNGGSEYETNGKIYILPNVSEKTTFSLSDCIEIQNVDGYGDKYNVVWGEDNDEQFNIAYLITNDNKNVRKLLLGKTDNTFNGTCILLEEYSQIDGLEVNQGTKFYKNRLYYNVGHSGIRVVCSTLEKEKVNSLEIPYNLYNSDGSRKLSCYGQGIAFKDDYCFVGCNDKIRVFKI